MSDPGQAPLDPEVLQALRQASTATLATQLYRRGLRQPFLVGVKPVNPAAASFAGEAFTMRFIPSREDVDPMDNPYRTGNVLQWEAMERVGPGQVIVVDSREDIRAGLGGRPLAFPRDVPGRGGLRHRRGAARRPRPGRPGVPRLRPGRHRGHRQAFFHVAELPVPIGCEGVAVYPGDVLVGDPDGVIVVPRALAPVIAVPAQDQERLEAYLHTRIQQGEPLWGSPDENALADYRAWQAQSPG